MKAGRKNLKRAFTEDAISLQEGHSIMQVVSLRGSNLIEVMDGKGIKSLALFPAKFQKSFWIKRGNFVVVDGNGRDEALGSGSKIACMVSQILYHEQVRILEKSLDWPEIFKSKAVRESNDHQKLPTTQREGNASSEGEEDLPPLEANLNRSRPIELFSDSDADSDPDS